MGDIWPYGPPLHVSQRAAIAELEHEGASASLALVLSAIGMAESSLDLRVINNTPATGDYSVGAWQINYFAGLDAERTRLFGTPKQLIGTALVGQAAAAHYIANTQGLHAWSTYTSGAYRRFLGGSGNAGAGGGPAPGGGTTRPGPSGKPVPSPATPKSLIGDTWSPGILSAADNIQNAALSNYKYAALIASLH